MSRNSYRTLFERAVDAIILIDAASGRIRAANRRATQLIGRTVQDVTALTYADIFDEQTLAALRPPAASEAVEDCFRDGELVRPDGSRCPVEIALSIVDAAAQALLQVTMRTSTARHRCESESTIQQLERQNAELLAAQTRLVEQDRVRTEFLGMMSHELRTPVNILIGYAHMLLESVAAGDSLPASERAGILRRMVAGGHTLSELVEDTLSVLRLDAGVVQLEIESVTLDRFFHELKGNDRLLRGPDAIEERWTVEHNVPPIRTDRRKLRQVITNLVGNARKFTTSGHIEVRAELGGPESIHITVTDTGCGISAEHLPNIFELYRQAPSGKVQDGCGIGLYIVRRYLEMLQGKVRCTSTLGKGTTFLIELPLEIQPAHRSAASTPWPRRPRL